MLRSAPPLRRGARLIRGPWPQSESVGPALRCPAEEALHRVRDMWPQSSKPPEPRFALTSLLLRLRPYRSPAQLCEQPLMARYGCSERIGDEHGVEHPTSPILALQVKWIPQKGLPEQRDGASSFSRFSHVQVHDGNVVTCADRVYRLEKL
jgi:hypothetical protein